MASDINIQSRHVACFGEIVWDDFPDAKRPGGAPGNYAFHVNNLGNASTFISRLGEDSDGDELISFLKSKGIATNYVQRDKIYPTGKVLVHGPPEAPYYTIVEDSAWDFVEFERTMESTLQEIDAFCFATLIQRSETSSISLGKSLAILQPSVMRVLDVNLRPPFFNRETIEFSLANADLVKMNEEEFELVGKMLLKENLIEWLLNDLDVTKICVTRGRDGAELITKEGRWEQPAYLDPDSRGDTVGVGDAFLAALTTACLNDFSMQSALDYSSRYASKVAAYKGAMPDVKPD